MKPKLFRDPVHDIISFDLDIPWEKMLFDLLCTPEVQRLRRIRQLGLANLIYPGAEHSRFTHSLGVSHLARRMLNQVTHGTPDPEIAFCTLAAALLHDTGHGPFSHAIEKVTGVDHEHISAALLQDPESQVFHVLSNIDAELPASVAALIGHNAPRSYYRDIVSSQMDADRLDYILRDGLATGVKISVYDLERILSTLEAEPGHLLVNNRAKEAVEGYLLTRFHMFKQVYLHGAVRAAEKMLEAIMSRAAELLREKSNAIEVPPGPMTRLLSGEKLPPMEFMELDDSDVWVLLKTWRKSSDPILSRLCTGLVQRDLYKTIVVPDHDAPGDGGPIDAAIRAVENAEGNTRYQLLIDRAKDTPYKPYIPGRRTAKKAIMVKITQGEFARIEECSDLVHLLGRDRYEVQRIFFPTHLRDAVTKAVQEAQD